MASSSRRVWCMMQAKISQSIHSPPILRYQSPSRRSGLQGPLPRTSGHPPNAPGCSPLARCSSSPESPRNSSTHVWQPRHRHHHHFTTHVLFTIRGCGGGLLPTYFQPTFTRSVPQLPQLPVPMCPRHPLQSLSPLPGARSSSGERGARRSLPSLFPDSSQLPTDKTRSNAIASNRIFVLLLCYILVRCMLQDWHTTGWSKPRSDDHIKSSVLCQGPERERQVSQGWGLVACQEASPVSDPQNPSRSKHTTPEWSLQDESSL